MLAGLDNLPEEDSIRMSAMIDQLLFRDRSFFILTFFKKKQFCVCVCLDLINGNSRCDKLILLKLEQNLLYLIILLINR